MTDNLWSDQSMVPEYRAALQRLFRVGLISIASFVSLVAAWSSAASWSGAVITSGQFIVDGNSKKVQHQVGGIIAEIRVKEGAYVHQGDLVLRLDDTNTKASLQIITIQIDQIIARTARLIAERDRKADFDAPEEFAVRFPDPNLLSILEGERALQRARAEARNGQKHQLSQRIRQMSDEIVGLDAQKTACERQISLISAELVGIRELFRKNLVPITRLNALERESSSLDGRRGQLISQAAQIEGRIAETQLQVIQIEADLTAEVIRELAETGSKLADLNEKRISAESELKRTAIFAPISGYVHQLTVHTIGGVLPAAEPAMLIVPSEDDLVLEVRVLPQDIDQVARGQRARVRINAFNQRVTPEVVAVVHQIAPDIIKDAQTGQHSFSVRLKLATDASVEHKEMKVVAGMHATAFLETIDRTPFDFLARPILDQVGRAFRER